MPALPGGEEKGLFYPLLGRVMHIRKGRMKCSVTPAKAGVQGGGGCTALAPPAIPEPLDSGSSPE